MFLNVLKFSHHKALQNSLYFPHILNEDDYEDDYCLTRPFLFFDFLFSSLMELNGRRPSLIIYLAVLACSMFGSYFKYLKI